MDTKKLKEIINENGLSIFDDYLLFAKKLIFSFNPEIASILLICLSNKNNVKALLKKDKDKESVTKIIEESTHFNHEYSITITDYLMAVFSNKQLDEWKKLNGKDIKEFLNSAFSFEDEINCIWEPNGCIVYMICKLEYQLEIKVVNKELALKIIKENFKNEFVKREDIEKMFMKKISEKIRKDFSYYCSCDDDCEPLCEDYSLNDVISNILDEYGLEIEADYHGSKSDYLS